MLRDIRTKFCFRVNPESTLFQRWVWSMNQRWQVDVESTWISRWPTSRRYFDIYQPWINVECFLGCGWVFIYARSLENCISVEGFNTLNTNLQSVLQNIKTLQSAKQGPFSLISEAAVQINFIVNLARFLKTSI